MDFGAKVVVKAVKFKSGKNTGFYSYFYAMDEYGEKWTSEREKAQALDPDRAAVLVRDMHNLRRAMPHLEFLDGSRISAFAFLEA